MSLHFVSFVTQAPRLVLSLNATKTLVVLLPHVNTPLLVMSPHVTTPLLVLSLYVTTPLLVLSPHVRCSQEPSVRQLGVKGSTSHLVEYHITFWIIT